MYTTFHLEWSLPPSLDCNIKQLDSEAGLLKHCKCPNLHPYGPLTLYGANQVISILNAGSRADPRSTWPISKPDVDFGPQLSPLHYQLPRKC
ncbi:hypothetical protein ACTXT7_017367, partial [Hymenolepis weldensis]